MIYREGPPAPGLPLRREHVGLHIGLVAGSSVFALALAATLATALDRPPAWATNATFVLCGFGVVSMMIVALGAARMLRGHPMPASALVVVAILPYLVGWWAIGTLGPGEPATLAEAARRMVEQSAHRGLADLFTASAFVVVAVAALSNVQVVVPLDSPAGIRTRVVGMGAAVVVVGLAGVRLASLGQAPVFVHVATFAVTLALLAMVARAGRKLPSMIDWHDSREAAAIVSSAVVGVIATGVAVVLFDDAIAAFGDMRLSALGQPPAEIGVPSILDVDRPTAIAALRAIAEGHAARARSLVVDGVLFAGLLVAVVSVTSGRRANGTVQPPWRMGAILPLALVGLVAWLGVVQHERGWTNLAVVAPKTDALSFASVKKIALPVPTVNSSLIRTGPVGEARVVVDATGDPYLVPTTRDGLAVVDARAPIGSVAALRHPDRRGLDLVLAPASAPNDPSLGALAVLVAQPPRTIALAFVAGEGLLSVASRNGQLAFTHPRLAAEVVVPLVSPPPKDELTRLTAALGPVGGFAEVALVVPRTEPTQRIVDLTIALHAWVEPSLEGKPAWAAPIVIVVQ